MNKAPSLLSIETIMRANLDGPHLRFPSGRLIPARPEGYFSLRSRIRLAWLVFRGDADVFIWPEDEPGGQYAEMQESDMMEAFYFKKP